jgi:RND family efflux transporter MFP subunit
MQEVASLLDLSTSYHACRDTDSLLKTAANRIGAILKARAVMIWLVSDGEPLVCRGRWFGAGVRFNVEAASEGIVVDILAEARAQRFAVPEAKPDMFSHLSENERDLVKTALYAPIPGPQGVAGVLEVLNKSEGRFTAEEAALAEEAARITGRALETHLAVEREQHKGLETIERLTALYDVSRAFNSVLELEELLPIVVSKIQDIMHAEVSTIWLMDSGAGEVYFAQQVGDDPTTSEDERLPLGEGLAGAVAKQGEALLVTNPDEELLLAARREKATDFAIDSVLCAPLLKDDAVLGVVEVLNKIDGTPFDEDDLFFLTNIVEQAAIAIGNANLLEAERKVHELDALLAISKEITSTLNLDRVLLTVVNQASTVLPFDRCAIALFDRGKLIFGAMSGMEAVPQTPETASLRQALEWVVEQNEPVHADRREEGWDVAPAAGEERVVPYLESAGYRGFYALPLTDEQGHVGVIALESREEDFLTEGHLELLSILASQTTVAVRNAQLYQQVPLINVMQPLLERKAKLLALPRARLKQIGVQVLLVAVLLVAVPWKMRIGANGAVVPAERRTVTAEVDGVVQKVLVQEGSAVSATTVLAELDASDDQVRLEQAQTNLALEQRQRAQAEAEGDLGAANQARLRMEIHQAEVELHRENVAKARLLAPVAGVVITPKIEEKVGQHLEKGDVFCELVDTARLAVEMNVPETTVDLIRPGAPVSLKLNAFPTHTYSARVERVSAGAVSIDGVQYFVVRATFFQPKGEVRTGMVGRAKISAVGGWGDSGWYPIGYVALRTPGRWLWRKAWTWLP